MLLDRGDDQPVHTVAVELLVRTDAVEIVAATPANNVGSCRSS